MAWSEHGGSATTNAACGCASTHETTKTVHTAVLESALPSDSAVWLVYAPRFVSLVMRLCRGIGLPNGSGSDKPVQLNLEVRGAKLERNQALLTISEIKCNLYFYFLTKTQELFESSMRWKTTSLPAMIQEKYKTKGLRFSHPSTLNNFNVIKHFSQSIWSMRGSDPWTWELCEFAYATQCKPRVCRTQRGDLVKTRNETGSTV